MLTPAPFAGDQRGGGEGPVMFEVALASLGWQHLPDLLELGLLELLELVLQIRLRRLALLIVVPAGP